MPTLTWIGKEAVEKHHLEVPFHLLKDVPELACGEPGSGNLVVQGDNLLALKALLPYYAGQVKCIYIDPPYNTGDESWVYNDNVRSPAMAQWLGSVVGKEGEDLSRHDKWLCMMYPRLSILRAFLRQDGVIFVSIDENEVGYLRMLMDEVFGRTNSLGTLVWKRRSSSAMRGTPLSVDHEYVLCYASDASRALLYGLAKGPESYPHRDERGRYASTDLTVGMGMIDRPNQYYPITNPRTGVAYPPNPERVWRFFPETMKEVIEKGLVIWPDDNPDRNMKRPRYKTYYDPGTSKPKPVSSWIDSSSRPSAEVAADEEEWDISVLSSGMNQEGGRTLQQILGRKLFAYPKPISLVASLVRAATTDGDLVLDSFAGSGTTAHSLLELNAQDGLERHFLLVEMEPEIARGITAERVRRVAEGYTDAKGTQVPGLGGSFRFAELGEPLFDQGGHIRDSVSFADLARHVYFTETGEPLPPLAKADSPLLGACRGTAVYLLYNGILGDNDPSGGNILTRAVLAGLPPHEGPKVIYANGCLLGTEILRRHHIVFKQTPYEIRVT